MKKVFLFSALLLLLTGCGDTKTLTCTASGENGDTKTDSTLVIKVNDDKVSSMQFTVDMIFPEKYQNQLQAMAYNIKMSKPYMQVSVIENGIRLITEDANDSFIGIDIGQEITYGELKEVLELQDYICEQFFITKCLVN